jgi:hypothetical protein
MESPAPKITVGSNYKNNILCDGESRSQDNYDSMFIRDLSWRRQYNVAVDKKKFISRFSLVCKDKWEN